MRGQNKWPPLMSCHTDTCGLRCSFHSHWLPDGSLITGNAIISPLHYCINILKSLALKLNKSLCCASSDTHCLVPLFLATCQLYVENNPSMSSSSLSETEWILLLPSFPTTMVLLSTAPKARLLSSSPLDLRHYFHFMNHYWSC